MSTEILEDSSSLPLPPEWDANDPKQNVTFYEFSYCNLTLAEDHFNPEPFEPSDRLERTNEIAFRFGGSNDMITLLQGTDEEKKDYVVGLVATSLFVAAFFLVWCIVLLVLQCSRSSYKRYGFLSGRFIIIERTSSPEHASYWNLLQANKEEQQQHQKEMNLLKKKMDVTNHQN